MSGTVTEYHSNMNNQNVSARNQSVRPYENHEEEKSKTSENKFLDIALYGFFNPYDSDAEFLKAQGFVPPNCNVAIPLTMPSKAISKSEALKAYEKINFCSRVLSYKTSGAGLNKWLSSESKSCSPILNSTNSSTSSDTSSEKTDSSTEDEVYESDSNPVIANSNTEDEMYESDSNPEFASSNTEDEMHESDANPEISNSNTEDELHKSDANAENADSNTEDEMNQSDANAQAEKNKRKLSEEEPNTDISTQNSIGGTQTNYDEVHMRRQIKEESMKQQLHRIQIQNEQSEIVLLELKIKKQKLQVDLLELEMKKQKLLSEKEKIDGN